MNAAISNLVWMSFLLFILFSAGISGAAEVTVSNKLFKAAGSRNIAEVKRLLDEGADPNVVAKSNNDTPIFRAVMALDYDAALLLLDRGARIDHKDIADMTVLTAACGRLDFKTGPPAKVPGSQAMRIVHMLVERGANVNLTPPPAGKREETSSAPLHSAAFNSNATVELFQFLISKGADVNQPMRSIEKGLDGVTPLLEAMMFNNKEIIAFLIDNGADVNARFANGDTAIGRAFLRDNVGNEGLQALLFAHGAILTPQDKRSVLQPMFSGFHENLKKRLVEVHSALCAAVAREPQLEKATMEQLLVKSGAGEGNSEFSIVSAHCIRGSCDVVMRHVFLYTDHCSPLGDLKACAGRITGPAGKTVITMSGISDITK